VADLQLIVELLQCPEECSRRRELLYEFEPWKEASQMKLHVYEK